jgi:phosphatidylglycerol:prolipoprotein diacylglycerol transferase
MDIIAVATPLGYVFGRIGNFLNQELIGRATDVPWGIYVDGVLRHPSQLYEAFLEGIVLFIVLFLYRTKKRFDGELIIIYAVGYGIARIVAEVYRQPDIQLGFICCDMITMGQVLSFSMVAVPVGFWFYLKKKAI